METTHRNKILLIERYDPFRESLAELLTLEGFKVLTAKKGSIGLMLAWEYQPDLIICARSFWDNNCWDVLQELRKEEQTNTTPFIFLSSKPASELHEAMQGQQHVATLIKPFQTEQLLSLIRILLTGENLRDVPGGIIRPDQPILPPEMGSSLPSTKPLPR